MATSCRRRVLLLLSSLLAVAGAGTGAAASHPAHEFCSAAGAGAGCGVGDEDGTRILIKGGTVVNAHRAEEADVYIEDGVVVAVRPNIPVGEDNVRVIDATGKYVMPGGIDPHTHLEMEFMGTVTIDDFFSGHAAALAGGTTMHIDFVIPVNGNLTAGLESYKQKAAKSAMDYGFHMAITKWNDEVAREMEVMVKRPSPLHAEGNRTADAEMASPDAELPPEPERWRDLDMLLSRPGNLVEATFDPRSNLRDMLGSIVEVLVVGAGGLGCELLKDLALSGFKKLHVIDMDTIDVSNLNRQFLFRVQDVGKSKAEVAAKRVMERVSGVNIVPHFCRIEDKEIEFYSQFHIIVLGLDSIEARSYINSVACGFLEYDSNDDPILDTVKPMVDGGTEGFKGHARVIIPGKTPCFECNIWLFPPQVKFPLCTLAETPRTAAHCIEYAHLIKWDEVHPGRPFDADDAEHMQWIYSEALKRSELFGISGVTYSLTQGVVKNIIPAIASTNAIISAACALEAFKLFSGCSKNVSNYLTYNGLEGTHIKVTEFVRDKDCLVCGPGTLIKLDTSSTLSEFIKMLEEHPKLQMSKASVTHEGNNLYMQSPEILEQMTRPNLSIPMFELLKGVPFATVHAMGMAENNGKKVSSLRKLRVAFKGVEEASKMDTTESS